MVFLNPQVVCRLISTEVVYFLLHLHFFLRTGWKRAILSQCLPVQGSRGSRLSNNVLPVRHPSTTASEKEGTHFWKQFFHFFAPMYQISFEFWRQSTQKKFQIKGKSKRYPGFCCPMYTWGGGGPKTGCYIEYCTFYNPSNLRVAKGAVRLVWVIIHWF